MNTEQEKNLLNICDSLKQTIESNHRLRDEVNWLRAHLLYFTLDLKGDEPKAYKQREGDEWNQVIKLFESGKIGLVYGNDFYFQRSGGTHKSTGILTREALKELLKEQL